MRLTNVHSRYVHIFSECDEVLARDTFSEVPASNHHHTGNFLSFCDESFSLIPLLKPFLSSFAGGQYRSVTYLPTNVRTYYADDPYRCASHPKRINVSPIPQTVLDAPFVYSRVFETKPQLAHRVSSHINISVPSNMAVSYFKITRRHILYKNN